MMPQALERLRRTLHARRAAALLLGLLLIGSGAGYGTWGAWRFHAPAPAPRLDPAARLARLFAPNEEQLATLRAETEREERLVEELRSQARTLSALVVLLARVLLAQLLFTTGVVMLVYGLSRRRTLALVDALGEALGRGPARPEERGPAADRTC
jgi:hypothetical protein